jgi:hypothetical protein
VTKLTFLLFFSAATCLAEKTPFGACYDVHGRLSFWNGAPSTRIWIIGTHRMLGVHDEDNNLPPNLAKLLKGDFDDEVFGNFVVCPLTRAQPGVMQMVYVTSASRLTYHHRDSY